MRPLPPRRPALLACALAALLASPGLGRAEAVLDPGDEIAFAQADACSNATVVPNVIEALANASSSCDAASRRLTAQVRPVIGPGFVGFGGVTRAFATLTNDFQVSADPGTEGHSVGAWISYDVDWNGRILLIGFLSKPSVELSIRLIDLTDGGKTIKGEMIWTRDDDAVGFSIPYVPVLSLNIGGGRDTQSVSNTFAAVLERGHSYRLALRLECAVISDGGLDVGTECDYEDNFLVGNSGGGAGWSRLAVKVGLDEAAVLEQLERLAEHTHVYLTGRGEGHNNAEARTGPALLPPGDGPPPDPGGGPGNGAGDDADGVPAAGDLCPATPSGRSVDESGCSQGQFCELQERESACALADWNHDEGHKPRDCRWRGHGCEVR